MDPASQKGDENGTKNVTPDLTLESVRDELMHIERQAQRDIAQSEAELETALDELEAAEQELTVALEDLAAVRGSAATSTTTSETQSAV